MSIAHTNEGMPSACPDNPMPDERCQVHSAEDQPCRYWVIIDNDAHNVLLKLQILEEYSKTREMSLLRLKKLFHSHDKQLSAPRVQVFRF